MKPERFEELVTRAVDALATPSERQELMAWLVDHPEARREYEAHLGLKALTDGWVARLEHDLVHDDWEAAPLVRAERGLGVFLVTVGLAVLSGWGFVELMLDAEVPAVVRWATAGLLGGTLLLLFSVVRWRLATHASDPYNKVIR